MLLCCARSSWTLSRLFSSCSDCSCKLCSCLQRRDNRQPPADWPHELHFDELQNRLSEAGIRRHQRRLWAAESRRHRQRSSTRRLLDGHVVCGP